jgi:hypothetical protein
MTAQQFIAKWRGVTFKESESSQPHFLDVCDLVGQVKPPQPDANGLAIRFEKQGYLIDDSTPKRLG